MRLGRILGTSGLNPLELVVAVLAKTKAVFLQFKWCIPKCGLSLFHQLLLKGGVGRNGGTHNWPAASVQNDGLN